MSILNHLYILNLIIHDEISWSIFVPLTETTFSFDGSYWIYTLSRSIICVPEIHKVLTPLSWSFLVDKERLSSNKVSKCVAR